MKILSLRFLNLNSLYGQWEIDFTSDEFISNGIFAITGPTGSGKSTILDAICLALYGATPRLGLITKSSNEIMSRKSGECYSEVVFKVNSGTYRAFWGQHRARKKSDGNLTDSKHEVSDYLSGRVIATKKKEVSDFVIDKCGMDLERFTRSMLLAQGSFSAFLRATPDERAPILEQITGTGIYSEISKKVHEQNRTESEKLNILQAESEGIKILSEEEESNLVSKLDEISKKESPLIVKIEKLSKDINNYNKHKELEKSYLLSKNQLELANKSIEEFKESNLVLQKSIKAYSIIDEYRLNISAKESYEKLKSNLETLNKSEPTLKSKLKVESENLFKVEAELKELKDYYLKSEPEIKLVRDLDNQRKSLINNREGLDNRRNKNIQTKSELDKKNSELLKILDSIKEDRDILKEYLEANSQNESITESIAIAKGFIDKEVSLKDKIYFREIESNKIKVTLDGNRDRIQKFKEEAESEKEMLLSLKLDLDEIDSKISSILGGRELKEYKTELNYLLKEQKYISTINLLEEERGRLINGKPCPLCGATEHPFSSGVDLEQNENVKKIELFEDVISKVEALQDKSRTLLDLKVKLESTIKDYEYKVQTLENEISENKKYIDIYSEDIKNWNLELKDILQNVSDIVVKYNLKSSDIKSVISDLENISTLYKSNVKRSNELSVELEKVLGSIKSNNEVLELVNKDLNSDSSDIELIDSRLKKIDEEKSKLLDGRSADEFENALKVKISNQEDIVLKLLNRKEDASREYLKLETSIKGLEEQIVISQNDYISSSNKFNIKVKEVGFNTIAEFEEALIPRETQNSLISKERELSNNLLTAKNRYDQLNQEYEDSLASGIDKIDIVLLENNKESLNKELGEIREEKGGITQQINQNNIFKEELQNKAQQISKQIEIVDNWRVLHSLIGSADGKKFRNFAQGLTFEQVIKYANRELVKLTDRYLLIRDNNDPLELNVVDNFQAGEVRSTKNLSGGESFLVSLALALGLSKMSSSRVSVDSLFLDEGFGTLDEDALDTALEALSGLHQEGKLIGVISHVSALKDRIPVQINIKKNSGGRGIISGPGVKKVD